MLMGWLLDCSYPLSFFPLPSGWYYHEMSLKLCKKNHLSTWTWPGVDMELSRSKYTYGVLKVYLRYAYGISNPQREHGFWRIEGIAPEAESRIERSKIHPIGLLIWLWPPPLKGRTYVFFCPCPSRGTWWCAFAPAPEGEWLVIK